MEITLAKTAGFCFGVKRAVEMVYSHAGKDNVYTYGPIIHNEEVVEDLRRKGLFPVGRLDKDTTGLLIITDDGDFAHRVLSPQKNIFKTYKAELDGDITEQTLDIFSKEITLADGTVCRRGYLKRFDSRTAEIKICEGRYHQIKRMFGVAGLGVNALERRAIGRYTLPDFLKRGECAEVSESELIPVFSNPDLQDNAY